MRVAVLKERRADEARVAATPETAKKLIALGCTVAAQWFSVPWLPSAPWPVVVVAWLLLVSAPGRMLLAPCQMQGDHEVVPSGPLVPKNVRKAPTLLMLPSGSSGPRHTWFARVTAT